MLNKITNISANSEYKNSARVSRYSRLNKLGTFDELESHDSINISPAFNFLKKINWQLKSVNTNNPEKVVINFVIEQYEFVTTVNIDYPDDNKFLLYSIKRIAADTKQNNVVLTLKVGMQSYNFPENAAGPDLSVLDNLFNRVSGLEVATSLTKNDTTYLNSLLEGLMPRLKELFSYINYNLFSFIDKFLAVRINFSASTIDDVLITVEKISSMRENIS